MTKLVLTYGLIAGVVNAVLMLSVKPLWMGDDGQMDMRTGELLGYLSMIIALSLIYFGTRSYRDNHLGGFISFGKAFKTGFLITLVASAFYATGWMIYYNTSTDAQNFPEQYMEYMLEELEKSGATPAEISQKREEFSQWAEWYKNPLIMLGMTLMEILPVGLAISLLSAFLLKAKPALNTSEP